jgi:hypothetical protein
MTVTPWASLLPFFGIPDQRQPLSGDVSQWLRFFSPTVNVNGRGDPTLEGEIVRDVATYGAQLGPLTAIVLALAEDKKPPPEALTKLTEICREIQAKKEAYEASAVDRARRALADLKKDDPAALTGLLEEFGGTEHPK